jgi:glycerol-3-phosphate acyltransferase PlsY
MSGGLLVGELFQGAPSLLLAIVAGYLLGSVPLAGIIARRHGVDIFSAGSGLPGASNILRTVGKVAAVVVFLGDVGKGALAVVVARYLEVDSSLLVLPAGAAVVGHWRPVFNGFRGGDGLATLGGIIIGMFPGYGSVSIAVALLVALSAQRLPFSSLLSIVFGYSTLVALSLAYGGYSALDRLSLRYDGDIVPVLGLGGLAGLVLAHALLGHHRRRQDAAGGEGIDAPEWDEVGDTERATGRQ